MFEISDRNLAIGAGVTTASELQVVLEARSGTEGRPLTSAALIEWTDRGDVVNRGIAICLGENLTSAWQSGDVIVFWDNGDHSMLVGGEIKHDSEIRVLIEYVKGTPLFNLLDRRVL